MTPNLNSKNGFSLVDAVVVTAIIAVIATVSIPIISNVNQAAVVQKLDSDTNTLNRAISVFLASGGNLSGAKTPYEILAKLRTSADAEVAKLVPGYSSSVVDQRVTVEMQTDKEASSQAPRAQWDSTRNRFVVKRSGEIGIKKFTFADAELAASEEPRQFGMLYSDDTDWIWDYREAPKPETQSGGTAVTLATSPDPVAPIPVSLPPVNPPTQPPGAPTQLYPPEFSIPGGDYTIGLFDLSLTLFNTNPSGSSKIEYSVDSGPWRTASGSLSVSPDNVITARAVPLSNEWITSRSTNQTYAANPEQLGAPFITADYDNFAMFFDYDITVEIIDPNPAGTSINRYRINGGSWQEYTEPVVLEKEYFPGGATIEARSFPGNNPYYQESFSSQKIFGAETLDLAGTTSGAFYNPTGPSGMVSNLSPGDSSSYFAWGNGDGYGRSQSWLEFASTSFGGVQEGQRFHLGNMSYYNGTIASDSGADTIDLDIGLSLDINGNQFNPYFDFTFDLVNSPNVADEWASADYVKLADATSSRTLIINDYELEFQLEMGETTSNGFSEFNEFYVLEDRDASVNLYGTLVSIGRIESPENGEEEVGQRDDHVDPSQAVSELMRSARESVVIAGEAKDDAREGKRGAERAADRTADKIDDRRYDRARREERKARDAAAFAEEAAQIAADAKAVAADVAEQVSVLASTEPSLASDAEEAAELAEEAEDYAAEARSAADSAAAAAATAAALIADLP